MTQEAVDRLLHRIQSQVFSADPLVLLFRGANQDPLLTIQTFFFHQTWCLWPFCPFRIKGSNPYYSNVFVHQTWCLWPFCPLRIKSSNPYYSNVFVHQTWCLWPFCPFRIKGSNPYYSRKLRIPPEIKKSEPGTPRSPSVSPKSPCIDRWSPRCQIGQKNGRNRAC